MSVCQKRRLRRDWSSGNNKSSYKLRISRIFLSVFIHNADDLFMDSKLWILLNPVTDQVQKHSETALDTPKNEGTESSFPIKMHSIPGKPPAICKISVVQPWCKKEKEKCKCLKIKHLHFVWYPEPGSNRHGLLHWCLRPARLPIPPSGLVCCFAAY